MSDQFIRDISDSNLENSVTSPVVTGDNLSDGLGGQSALTRYHRQFFKVFFVVLGLMTLVGVGALINQQFRVDSNKFGVSNIPLSDTVSPLLLSKAANLNINGDLRVNAGFIITPSEAPENPEIGQIYFDQTTQKPYYYDGKEFICLIEETPATTLTSIGGASGVIGLGNGLQITNGQLRLTDAILQGATAPGATAGLVSSVQGQTGDVSFSGGNGIAVNGTGITNTGLLSLGGASGNVGLGRGLSLQAGALRTTVSLTSGSANLIISEDGNGNYTITDNASGTTPQIELGPTVAQTDATGNTTININKTSAGNFLQLASNGVDEFVVDQTGAIISGSIAYAQVTGAPTTVTSLGGASGAISLGTGLNLAGSTLSHSGVTSLAGTANQVSVSGATGVVTLSLPQAIATTSSPSFNSISLTGAPLGIGSGGTNATTAAGARTNLGVAASGANADITSLSAATSVGSISSALTLQGNAGSVFSGTASGFTTSVGFASPTANVSYRFLTATAGTYDVCSTAGNCAGVGGGVTTAGGTSGRIAKFTGSQTLADSLLSESGSVVTVGGTLAVNTIAPTAAFLLGVTGQNVTVQGAAVAISSTAGGFTNTLSFATPAGSSKTITVPNASGTVVVSASGPLAVDVNGNVSCASCTVGGGGSGGAVDSLNAINGDVLLQGTSNQIVITNDGGTRTITVSTPQDINTSSSPTFSSLTATSNLTVTNAISSGSLSTGGTLAVTGTTTLTGALTANGGTTTTDLNVTGNYSQTGTGTFSTGTGTVTLNGDVTVAAGKTISLVGGITSTRPASPTAGMLYYDSTTNTMLQYNGTKWVSDRNTSTKIVAASNSTQAIKDSADYVATGTADQAIINTALTAAAGGSVYLAEGTYLVSASISIPNNTTLFGAGAGSLITVPNAQNGSYSMITNATTGGSGTKVIIRDLLIDGNKVNQTSGNMQGIYMNGIGSGSGSSAVDGVKIDHVTVRNTYGAGSVGINLNASSNSILTGNTVLGTLYGIYLSNAANFNTLTGNISQGNGYGIYLQNSSTNTTITGNTVQGNTNTGIWVTNSSSYTTITGNSVQGGSNGIYVTFASNNTVSGNTVQGSSSTGVLANNSSYNVISGNNLQSITSHGVRLESSSNYNSVSGNKIHDSGGATGNNGIYITSSDNNSIISNDISDTACAAASCFAINIFNSTSDLNYLADNRFSDTDATDTASINDVGTGTVYANQTTAVDGGQLVVRTADNATAFSVQNAAGNNVLTVDSLNGEVELGKASTLAGLLTFYNATNAFTGTLQIAAPAQNTVYTLPATGATDTICLQTLLNCSGAGVTTVGAFDGGTANADGATITSSTLYLQSASSSFAGLVNTSAQSFAGIKTFDSSVTLSAGATVAAGQSIALVGGITGTRPASPTEGMLYYDTTTKALLIYANGKWQADRSSNTYLVSATNSINKDSADFSADGNTAAAGDGDQVQINQALTAAAAAGGGTVYLMEGTFTIDASISIPNNTKLVGAGAATVITLPNSFNADINMIVNSDIVTGTRVKVENLLLNGNKANQTSGTMHGIFFSNMGGGSGSTSRDGAKITGIWVRDTRHYGIYLTSSNNSSVTNSTSQGNTNYGMFLQSSGNSIVSSNTFQGNGSTGLYVQASGNNVISGNVVDGNSTNGIMLNNSSNNNVVSANKLHDNGGTTTNNGIVLAFADSNTVVGNDITDNSCTTSCYAINISASGSDTNYLADNTLSFNGTINDLGTGTRYANQINSSGDLIIKSASGRVGINSLTPAEVLHVYNGNLQVDYGNIKLNQVLAPTAPTVSVNATAGNLSGTLRYVITFVTATGETNYGMVSASVSPSAQQVDVTNIPLGTSGVVTARKIYRGTSASGPFSLVTTIANNTTTTYTDNIANGSLGAQASQSNTTAGGKLIVNNATVFNVSTTADGNSFIGLQAGNANTTGTFNSVLGSSALSVNTTGSNNNALGYQALMANTTGDGNVALGSQSLRANTTGASNIGIGYQTLYSNIGGGGNIAIGVQSQVLNVSGNFNTAVGQNTLVVNTAGTANAAFGTNSLYNSTASNNTAVGYQSLYNTSTGGGNVAIGINAGSANTTGSNNTLVGNAANVTVVGLTNATAIGFSATVAASNSLVLGGTGANAVKVGIGTTAPAEVLNVYNGNLQVDYGNIKLNQLTAPTAPTVAVNVTAGNLTGPLRYVVTFVTATGETNYGTVSVNVSPTAQRVDLTNIPLGPTDVVTARKIYRGTSSSGPFNLVTTIANNTTTTYTDNIASGSLGALAPIINKTSGQLFVNGSSVLTVSTLAEGNVLLGYQAGSTITTGNENTAIGYRAFRTNTTGSGNTVQGANALALNTTGSGNIALGSTALFSNTTGSSNVSIGSSSLQTNTTGNFNTAIGTNALERNTTASQNTATGYYALQANTTGSNNAAHGFYGLQVNTTGARNTSSGAYALSLNTTGNNNTSLGFTALGANMTGSNNTAVGYYAGYVDPTVGAFFSGTTLQNATTLGYGSQVQASNSLILGGQDANAVNVGIGTTIPSNTLSVSPVQYSAGTASRTNASSAVTGTGTTWTSAMVGNEIIFADGFKATVTAVGSATSLTISSLATVTDGAPVNYRIHHVGLQVTSGGNVYVKNGASANAFQVQDASGTSILNVDASTSTLTVRSVVITVSLTVNGHIISGNASGSTTAAAGSTAGTGASVVITGNDTSGKIVITTGTGATVGDLADITFANAYGAAPNIVITAGDASAALLQTYVLPTTTTFEIYAPTGGAGLADSTSYTFYYHIIE